jgi:hypothetical protein
VTHSVTRFFHGENQCFKCFDQTFSKVCGVKGRSPCRTPQSAKFLAALFFLRAFSFAPTSPKEKADEQLDHIKVDPPVTKQNSPAAF